jgi:hypothetical protein
MKNSQQRFFPIGRLDKDSHGSSRFKNNYFAEV